MNSPFMFFDVESIGLHGEGFAVGFVVASAQDAELEFGVWACPSAIAIGEEKDRQWVANNVPPLPQTHDTPRAVRAAFWQRWLYWRAQGAVLVADCPWPVEARFLNQCIDDIGATAHWLGPYPLLDTNTLRQLSAKDNVPPSERQANELPLHHPLADARYACRCFLDKAVSPNYVHIKHWGLS